ncbi:hypothetical protein [Acetobacter persici]|uniref:Uncharacterized protein n=1 Tax=Acetobacter persici TaxID=1076596 RepID=A0A6V8I766_9PROT|nr:hypothetical protein [Acetobacter persici]OUI92387.1 hypothetical protein HK19_01965 [Acetobacter persici]GFE93351.1 hypothetical protein DmAi_14100 [Acetobacter persici]
MTTLSTNSHAITPLVTAGVDLFETLTGKPLSENATKVSMSVTSLLDGLFPVFTQNVRFDLDGILTGSTEILSGLNTAFAAARNKAAQGMESSQRVPAQSPSVVSRA